MVEFTTQLLILKNILWLPLCRINKFGLYFTLESCCDPLHLWVISRVIQVPKPDLMAKGIAVDLLQMAKRVGPQCEAAAHEDLSGEENLTLDRIVTDDRRSHHTLR